MAVVLIAVWGLFSAAQAADGVVSPSLEVPLDAAYAFKGIAEFRSLEDRGVLIRAEGRPYSHLVFPLQRKMSDEKLRFRFRNVDDIRYIVVNFGRRGQAFSRSLQGIIHTDVLGEKGNGLIRHLRVPDGDYDRIRLTIKSRRVPSQAVLESITVQPLELWDHVGWSYAIAVGLGLLLLLPGALLYVFLHGQRASESGFLVSIFAYSLLFYVASYLFLAAALEHDAGSAHAYTLAFSSAFLAALLVLVFRNDGWARLGRLVYGCGQELAAYTLLLLLLCLVITHDANLPLENLYYRDISGPKTFGAFFAHDNLFQFVNGLAIADHEPFAKYYANSQLIYQVEDREILPGVVYAVFRALMSPLSSSLEKSYFVYTLLGISMNLVIVFPASALARRFLGVSGTFLFVLLLSANAFMIGEYLVTWFKLTAAALFLSGVYCALEKRAALSDWARSGLFFGLGANMHAGSALGIPFFFLWAVWRRMRGDRVSLTRALLPPLALTAVFLASLAPWTTVKSVYLHERHVLIKSHFLGGHSSPDGLAASARLFVENTTWEDQVEHRVGRLKDTFRLAEIGGLPRELDTAGFKAFLGKWDQHEFNYIAFVLYPLILFATAGWLYRCYGTDNGRGPVDESPDSRGAVLWLSVLTMLAVVLAHYGRNPPDIVYHQPMGVLVLACMALLSVILRSGRAIAGAFVVYAAFGIYRLAVFL